MVNAEFAEKTYETLMNMELPHRSRIFAPGQVDEHHIGIDAAIFTEKRILLKLFGFESVPSGKQLNRDLWNLDEKVSLSKKFPKFKCNIFIQYKIPEFIKSPNGREYSHWNKHYFRYDINSKQQEILYKLESKISSNSIVAYSCPAFYTW